MSRRTERIGSLIREEIGMMILRDLSDPRLESGFPSVTRVRVSEDLSVADVYITVMGSAGQQNAALAALRHCASRLRGMLTPILSLRQCPYLKFHLDDRLKKELELMGLLEEISKEDAAADARQAEANAAQDGTSAANDEADVVEQATQEQSTEPQSAEITEEANPDEERD